jgi:hypothetical protein
VLERDMAPNALPEVGAPAAAGVVGEQAALAVPDGDGAALLQDVGKVGADDEVAVAMVEDDFVEPALVLVWVKADDSRPCLLLGSVPPYRGAVEGVGDLLLVVDGDLDVLAVPAELRRELARAADAGDG